MEKELEALAGKVEQVARLLERLQAENASLKRRLATGEAERERLRQNMDVARSRVETLLEQIPEEA
ncbi:MAG: hypothetical protein LBS89_04305 [Zoogloeaceae bacterium]|jgi:cell division protein ZapB|nr:hypothetical protein [Zoogloeaceae bacterium]